MKKYMQITLVLAAFFILVWLKNMRGADENPVVGKPIQQSANNNNPNQITVAPTTTSVQTSIITSVPSALYKNGTYTGNVADAYYGNLQVQAIINGGKLADVVFLQYPNDNGTSRRINEQSNQILKSEALQAQNAQVDIVSGASDSSQAFQQSLASALQQAK